MEKKNLKGEQISLQDSSKSFLNHDFNIDYEISSFNENFDENL